MPPGATDKQTKRWEHRKALSKNVPWVPRHLVLPVAAALMFILNIVTIVVLAVNGLYHLDFYTYWNFIIVTILHGGIAVFYPLEGWPSSIFTLVWAPIAYGSVALVVFIIFIVIAIDDRVYVSGTVADATAVNPLYNFKQIRTGDWYIHGVPLLQVLILLLFGYQIYWSALIYHWERSEHWLRRIWYWVYFYVAPLVPMVIYMLIFNPEDKYTDKLTRAEGFGIAVGLDIVIMTTLLIALRTTSSRPVVLPEFYPGYLQAPPTKDDL